MRVSLRVLAAVAALAASSVAPPAAAEVKSALTGAEIEAVLAEAGLGATAMSDLSSGAPVFKVVAEDGEFFVRALDCAGAREVACATLVLFRNFSLQEGRAAPMHYEIVNEYNETKLSGRAYVLKGTGPGGADQVGVDYVVELDGGVSTEHLARRIALWNEIVRAFIAKFREGRAARS